MTDYSVQIDQIRQAKSLEEIREVARQFSAKTTGEGGILYSRPVGSVSSERIAIEIAEKTGLPIINNTPRAEFLSDVDVKRAIAKSAQGIFLDQGQTLEAAKGLTASFQYGDPKAAAHSLTSLDGCLWGDASREFAASLRGDIKVVATAANMERVFGKVELTTILDNPNVKTLGGQPIALLRDIAAKDGVQTLLNPVQSQFVEAAPRGIFKSPGVLFDKEAPVILSREFASTMGIDTGKFSPAANLSASGTVVRADIGMAFQVAQDEVNVARISTLREAVVAESIRMQGASVPEASPGLAVAENATIRSTSSRGIKAAGALGVAGLALEVYDGADNLREELDATRDVLQARLPPPREIPPVPPMDADARLRDTIAGAYRNAGVDPSAEQIAVAATAVRATWDANGLDPATTALQAQPRADGQYGADSPIASMRLEADGRTYAIAAVTTTEDIQRAQTVRDTAPHAIDKPSEQTRDAQGQATREANRLGLSQDEVQQAAAVPTRLMAGGKRDDGLREQDTPRDDAQQKRADNDHTALTTTTAAPIPPPARPTDPRDPDHPDHRLHKQIETGVAKIDAENGRTFDATSERLTMGAFHDAKAAGMTSTDHVVLNQTGAQQRDGSQTQGNTLLIAIQGQDPYDPAARRSVTDVKQAVEQPLEQSLQKVNVLEQQQQQTLAQQQNNPTPDGPTRGPRV